MVFHFSKGEVLPETNYVVQEELGQGAFAIVYLVYDSSGNELAVKVMEKTNISEILKKYLVSEVLTLKSLFHPNIVKLYDAQESQRFIYLIMEYCSGGSLKDFRYPLPERTVRCFAAQIAEALRYLQANRIAHRDLKPANVLLSGSKKDPRIKVADFGFARLYAEDLMLSCVGTPMYQAPEVRKGPYDNRVDLWSLGTIVFQLLVGRSPILAKNQNELNAFLQTNEVIPLPSSSKQLYSSHCRDFVSGLLRTDPEQRMTWDELFSHPFLLPSGTPITVLTPPSNKNDFPVIVNQYVDLSELIDFKGSTILHDSPRNTVELLVDHVLSMLSVKRVPMILLTSSGNHHSVLGSDALLNHLRDEERMLLVPASLPPMSCNRTVSTMDEDELQKIRQRVFRPNPVEKSHIRNFLHFQHKCNLLWDEQKLLTTSCLENFRKSSDLLLVQQRLLMALPVLQACMNSNAAQSGSILVSLKQLWEGNRRRYDNLIVHCESAVEKMRSCRLHPALICSGREYLTDLVDIQDLLTDIKSSSFPPSSDSGVDQLEEAVVLHKQCLTLRSDCKAEHKVLVRVQATSEELGSNCRLHFAKSSQQHDHLTRICTDLQSGVNIIAFSPEDERRMIEGFEKGLQCTQAVWKSFNAHNANCLRLCAEVYNVVANTVETICIQRKRNDFVPYIQEKVALEQEKILERLEELVNLPEQYEELIFTFERISSSVIGLRDELIQIRESNSFRSARDSRLLFELLPKLLNTINCPKLNIGSLLLSEPSLNEDTDDSNADADGWFLLCDDGSEDCDNKGCAFCGQLQRRNHEWRLGCEELKTENKRLQEMLICAFEERKETEDRLKHTRVLLKNAEEKTTGLESKLLEPPSISNEFNCQMKKREDEAEECKQLLARNQEKASKELEKKDAVINQLMENVNRSEQHRLVLEREQAELRKSLSNIAKAEHGRPLPNDQLLVENLNLKMQLSVCQQLLDECLENRK